MKRSWSFSAGILLSVLFLFVAIFSADVWVSSFANNKVYDDVLLVPERKVAVLLGTSKYVSDGRKNLFYLYRIQAAYELFEAGKVDFLLVSGDNGELTYNEPETMKDDLIEMGVPEERIYLDYAGFRTLDSMIRAKEVFGLEEFVVVSQRFHNERAIFIASFYDLDVVGYNAQDVPSSRSMRVVIREKVARLYMMFDLLRGTDPKFLGESIVIE